MVLLKKIYCFIDLFFNSSEKFTSFSNIHTQIYYLNFKRYKINGVNYEK